MNMAEDRVGFFIDLNHAVEQCFDAETRPAHGRYHRDTQHPREGFVVELVPLTLQFVVHVEGDDHPLVHVD